MKVSGKDFVHALDKIRCIPSPAIDCKISFTLSKHLATVHLQSQYWRKKLFLQAY